MKRFTNEFHFSLSFSFSLSLSLPLTLSLSFSCVKTKQTKLCSCGLWCWAEIVELKRISNHIARCHTHFRVSLVWNGEIKFAVENNVLKHYLKAFQRNVFSTQDFCVVDKSKPKQFRLRLQGECPIFGYFLQASIIQIKI